jgi:hypothetical protein
VGTAQKRLKMAGFLRSPLDTVELKENLNRITTEPGTSCPRLILQLSPSDPPKSSGEDFMEKLNMSLDYLAILPATLAVVLGAANIVIIVMKLMHKDKFVSVVLDSLANIVWVLRLGGGAGHWKGRRHTMKVDGHT